MAELPRYQQVGSMPGDVPRLDLANVKEQISLTKGVSASLDRMSEFAFKKSYEKAQREGEQYGAENRPGAEQVMLALEQNKSPNELFAQPGTYFGDAARKVQAAQLRIELEAVSRQDLSKLDLQFRSGQIDLNTLTSEIKARSDGYGRALASVDANESLRFRASYNTASNAIYERANETAIKLNIERLKILANDSLAATPTIISNTIESESDPEMLVKRVRVERERVMDILTVVNDPQFFGKSMKDFDQKLVDSMVEYLGKPEISKNSAEVFSKLQSGNVGKLSSLYKTLDKNDVISGYMKRLTENKTIIDANRSIEKMSNEKSVNSMLIEYYSPNTDQLRKRDLGVQMARSNVLSVDQMERFLNPDVKDGDPVAFSNIKYQVVTGVISDPDELRKITTRAGFSGKQYSALSNELISRTEKDETKGYKMISSASGFGDVRPGKTKNNEHQFKKEQKILEYYIEAKEASVLDSGSFNPQAVAQIAIDRYDNTDRKSAQKKDAQDRMDRLATDIKNRKRIKTEFVLNVDTNLEDLLAKKIISNDEYTALTKMQNTLKAEVQ